MRRIQTHILIAILILANLVFANIVFAQTTSTISLTKNDLNTAKSSLDACNTFSNNVSKFTNGAFKAFYHQLKTGGLTPVYACDIVESTFNTNSDISLRSGAATTLQNTIYYSQKGITQADYQNALTQGSKLDQEASLPSKFAGIIVSSIVKILTFVVFQLTFLAGSILSWALGKGTFNSIPPSVNQAWTIMRDLFNMFFILVLIIMSIATILRRDEYSYRKILLKLILAALLINFSQVICTTIIYAADKITVFLANGANLTSYTENMARILKPDTSVSAIDSIFSSNGFMSDAIRSISGFILALVMMSAYLAVALLLVVRYVGLLIAVVVSPAAVAMYAFPPTKKYFDLWRDHLVKYTIWLPMAVFFMRIGNLFFQTNPNQNVFKDTQPDFSLLIIAGFYWGVFYVVRKSGVYGAQTVANWASGTGDFVGRYIARGTAAKHVGMLADKGLNRATGLVGKKTDIKFFQKPGEKWERGSQYVEAAPGAVKAGFNAAGEQYKKGVASAKKELLYQTGFVEDEEMLKNSKDTFRLFQSKLKSDKFNVGDMHELIEKTSRKSLPGAIEALKEVSDADMRREANLAILKKMDERNAMPGTDLLKELPYGPTAPGESGFRYVDEKDHLKGMYLEYFREDRNNPGQIQAGAKGHQIRRYNAQPKADELSVMTPQAREEFEVKYKQAKEDLKKLNDRRTALQNDPDAKVKMLKAQTTGEVLDPGKERTAQEIVDAYEGAGQRIDLEKSIVTDTGKVFINADAAEAMGLGHAQDAVIPKEEFESFKQILREHGGVTQREIQKLETAFENNIPSIQVQRGVSKPIAPVIRESLGDEGVKALRVEQRQEGEHEGIHRFADFIKESNQQLYDQLTNKIISSDNAKFEEIKKQIQSIPEYTKLTNEQIAEEIMASAKFRNQLEPNLLKDINSSIQQLRKDYMKAIFNTARANKISGKSVVLARNIAARNPELSQEANFITRRI